MDIESQLEELKGKIEALTETVGALTAVRHGENTILGKNSSLDPTCRLVSNKNATISIGDNTIVWRDAQWVGPIKVGSRVFINQSSYIRPGVTLEDDVSIGPFVRLSSDTHDISTGSRRTGTPRKLPIKVGRGTWIGAGAIVLGGVTIGSRAIVAAGAVVVDDVPDNAVVGGVPAKVLRIMEDPDPQVAV